MNKQYRKGFRLTLRWKRRLGFISIADMIMVFVGAGLMVAGVIIGWVLFLFGFVGAMFIGFVWMLFK